MPASFFTALLLQQYLPLFFVQPQEATIIILYFIILLFGEIVNRRYIIFKFSEIRPNSHLRNPIPAFWKIDFLCKMTKMKFFQKTPCIFSGAML